jgi:hypothetical protein
LNIPSSAGNFSYHRLRKLFDIQIIQTSVEDGNKKMVLQFIARKDSTTLFSGIAWINFTEKTIEQLYFSIRDNSFFYLQPIFEGDKTDLTQVSLGFTFDNSDKGHPVIDRVSLDYSLIYTSLRLNNTIKIASEGNLILYDYSNPFPEILPKGLLESQVNDYQKISCLPYDSVFWSSQIVTPQSDKQKSFIDYFRSNGILVNFSKSLDSITGSNYIHWSANSDVSFIDIPNKAPSPKNHSLSIGMLPSVNAPDYPPCDVICKIIVNPLNMIDSLHLSSITLLNRTDSYYLLGNSLKATVFINLVFDLYEEQRRELVTTCNQLNKLHKLNLDEFQFIYSKALKQGNDTINIFKAETENGTSFEELDSWYSVISAKIGVDRCSLIQKMENEEALAEQVKMNTISEEDKFMKE